MFWTLVELISIILTVTQFIPQVIKAAKTKNEKGRFGFPETTFTLQNIFLFLSNKNYHRRGDTTSVQVFSN